MIDSHRSDFDHGLDGTCRWLMSSHQQHYPGRFPEPPPATCRECDDLIDPNDYDNPMPVLCRPCREQDD